MFYDKEVEAYRGIKAPDSLREKVMASCGTAQKSAPVRAKRRKSVFAAWSAVAACLVAAVAIWSFFGLGSSDVNIGDGIPEISVSAASSKTDAFGISLAREMDINEVVVSVSCDGAAFASVNFGTIFLKGEEISGAVDSLEIQDSAELVWKFSAGEGDVLILTVETNGAKHAFRLVQNAESGEWNICPEE